jgi:hypothetical protein
VAQTIPILVIVVDLGPTTLQQPYAQEVGSLIKGSRTLMEQVRQENTEAPLPGGRLRSDRLFMNLDSFHPFLAATWLLERTEWPTPQAEHRRILPSMMAFVTPFERYLNRVLRQLDNAEANSSIATSSTVIGGLHMLNVRRLLAVQKGNDGSRVVEWRQTSPILVSQRLEPRAPLAEVSPTEDFVDWALARFPDQEAMQTLGELYPVAQLIADTGVHVGRNSCARIFVADLDAPLDLATSPDAQVRTHQVWDQRVEIEAEVTDRCFARLAYAYFPSLSVRVNGVETETMKSSGGFLVIPLGAGENRIEIAAQLSPLRRLLLGIDLLLVFATVWLWRRERRLPPV